MPPAWSPAPLSLITCLGALLGFGKQSLEKVTGYVTEGFLFAIRIFAPVIIIGAFFLFRRGWNHLHHGGTV